MVRMAAKTAGILLIFLASCFLGDAAEAQLKRRWMALREMCELLRYMEREMICHRTPLEEALRLAAGSGMQELGPMLTLAARRVREQSGASFREIWQESAARCLGRVLSGPACELVRESWTAFCNQDVVMQKAMLEKQEARFSSLCQDAEREYREKSGLYRRLGAAGGIFLIILLL